MRGDRRPIDVRVLALARIAASITEMVDTVRVTVAGGGSPDPITIEAVLMAAEDLDERITALTEARYLEVDDHIVLGVEATLDDIRLAVQGHGA